MTWPYPAPVDRGGARHLVAGTPLPDVTLTSTDGGTVRLTDLAGVAAIVVYPWTGRPGLPNPQNWDSLPGAHGSTPELEGLRNLDSKFMVQGVTVFAISGQDTGHQRELALRLKLPFPILSDEGFAFADALQLPRFETGGKKYLERLTLVARAGRIVKVFYPIHPPDLHAAELLQWLRSGA
ncbi:MAG: peroxiredoxin [Hyphomicrobium sp.]